MKRLHYQTIKDTEIRKLNFVAKTQFLCSVLKKNAILIICMDRVYFFLAFAWLQIVLYPNVSTDICITFVVC